MKISTKTRSRFMEIFELIDRPSNLINNLIEIWEDSVKATHLFLSSSEIKSIKNMFPKLYEK